jgi:hypothetical protein
LRRFLLPLLDALPAVTLAGPVVVAAWVGTPGPLQVRLDLGPGDSRYVEGFLPEYEVFERTATHWAARDGIVDLPVDVEGGPLTLVLLCGRPLEDPGTIDVVLGGVPMGRAPLRRASSRTTLSLPTLERRPARIAFHVQADDEKPLGARFERIRLDLGSRARLYLRGGARFRAAALVLVLFLVLRLAAWPRKSALLLVSPVALAATLAVRLDPWLLHRLLTDVPEWLLALGLGGAAVGRALSARDRLAPATLRSVAALGSTAFLMRVLPLNHPDFYYPDLRSHVQLALDVRAAGFDFLRDPARHLLDRGVWCREIAGRLYAFPYTPAFHVPFALSRLGYDDLVTAVKLGAAVASVVPILALAALARGMGASLLGPALLLAVPVYAHHLSVTYLAALFGHAFDMTFVAWIARRLDRILVPPVLAASALLLALSELSYVGSTTILPVFVTCLALADLSLTRRPVRAVAILGLGVAGSLLAIAVYYHHFLGLVRDIVALKLAGGSLVASGDAPPSGFFETAVVPFRRFFGGPWAPLAAAGLVVLWRRGASRALLLGWTGAFLVLLLGRARLPFLFQHPHEALFVAPLVCLAAGEAVRPLVYGTGVKRVVGGLLLLALVAYGLARQWEAFALQLANA